MTAHQVQHIITRRMTACASTKTYWQFDGHEWEAMSDSADLNGTTMRDVLRGLGLSILDRAQSGAVHLG